MSAFAQAMREATFARRNKDEIVEVTVSATLSYVAQAFRSNNRTYPRLDDDGKTFFILQEQFRGYRWHQVKAEVSTYDDTEKNAGARSI